MAVRRIPINVRSLTGQFNGQEFESSLERDLLLLAHYDYGVEWYETQPVTIDYRDLKSGRKRTYTPDLLVMYQDAVLAKGTKPLLCEVKYREELAHKWKKLKPKFKAARAYARERGWMFKIFTDKEIRTPYLKNVKFLLSYRYATINENHRNRLTDVLERLGQSDPHSLIQAAYRTETEQGEALWSLWAMVAQGLIACDLESELTMSSRLWSSPR